MPHHPHALRAILATATNADRTASPRSPRGGVRIAAGIAATAVVAALAVLPSVSDRSASATPAIRPLSAAQQTAAPLGYPRLLDRGSATWSRSPHELIPDPSRATYDVAPGGCTITGSAATAKICWEGDPASTTTIALVGDSHAFQWLGAFDLLAREHHWRLLSIMHNSCPFNLAKRTLEIDGGTHCAGPIRAALTLIAQSHVRVLITSAYRTGYTGREAAGTAGYVSMWRSLEKQGVAVVALGDIPQPTASPTTPECASGPSPEHCEVPRRIAERTPDIQAAAARLASVPFVDPVDAFCRPTWCPGVIGNLIAYRDVNHAGNTYVLTTLPWLDAHLAPVIRSALETSPH